MSEASLASTISNLKSSCSEDAAQLALTTCLKLCANILANSGDDKYRHVKMTNAKLQASLFSATGGREVLQSIGFIVEGDALVFPASASLVKLLQSKNAIEEALTSNAAATAPVSSTAVASAPDVMDVDAGDEDEDLQAALAMSIGNSIPAAGTGTSAARALASSAAAGDADDDMEMQAAVALSLGETASVAPAAAPQAMDVPSEKERLQARVREIFGQLVAGGMTPNGAAAKALEQASSEIAADKAKAATAALAPAPAPHADAALLDKAGFEARVKALFAAAVAEGNDANQAAATALRQAQAEQLAAAQQARRERSGGDSSGAPARPNDSSAPSLVPQISEEVEQFERWEEIEKVAQTQVDAINVMYREEGVTFIDPSFPPSDRALYLSTESATHWKCRSCSQRNPLPPPPSAQELARLLTDRSMAEKLIQCAHCRVECNVLEVALRPSGWGRPNELRDDVTLQFSTVPWAVIRDVARPDDIRQGHVGNCWLVCAMSALAEDGGNIRKLILTEGYNPAGVYQVRLCLSGVWHCVVIDDLFPINGLSCLAYLKVRLPHPSARPTPPPLAPLIGISADLAVRPSPP